MAAAIKTRAALRSSEWLLIGYFSYVALITPLFPLDPQVKWLALAVFVLVASLLVALAFAESYGSQEIFSIARDWIPFALTLVAYREMDWFSPLDAQLQSGTYTGWSGIAGCCMALVYSAPLSGWARCLPAYLEFCYLLVYAVGPISVAYVVRSTAAGIGESVSAVVSGRDAAGLRAVTVLSFRSAAHAVRRNAICPM